MSKKKKEATRECFVCGTIDKTSYWYSKNLAEALDIPLHWGVFLCDSCFKQLNEAHLGGTEEAISLLEEMGLL
jgi:hypothetical protein